MFHAWTYCWRPYCLRSYCSSADHWLEWVGVTRVLAYAKAIIRRFDSCIRLSRLDINEEDEVIHIFGDQFLWSFQPKISSLKLRNIQRKERWSFKDNACCYWWKTVAVNLQYYSYLCNFWNNIENVSAFEVKYLRQFRLPYPVLRRSFNNLDAELIIFGSGSVEHCLF